MARKFNEMENYVKPHIGAELWDVVDGKVTNVKLILKGIDPMTENILIWEDKDNGNIVKRPIEPTYKYFLDRNEGIQKRKDANNGL